MRINRVQALGQSDKSNLTSSSHAHLRYLKTMKPAYVFHFNQLLLRDIHLNIICTDVLGCITSTI